MRPARYAGWLDHYAIRLWLGKRRKRLLIYVMVVLLSGCARS